MQPYARGKRGLVFLEEKNGNKIVVKTNNPKSKALNKLQNEASFLELLNKYNIGPKFISFENNELRMEFIDGYKIIDYLKITDSSTIKKILIDVINQMLILDNLGINKYEMTNPYKHIIVRINDNKPILIDFERCRRTKKPKNLTQFMQFLMSKKIKEVLEKNQIFLDSKKIVYIMKEYRRSGNLSELF